MNCASNNSGETGADISDNVFITSLDSRLQNFNSPKEISRHGFNSELDSFLISEGFLYKIGNLFKNQFYRHQ